MKIEKQTIAKVKKAKGNLVSLTVKDVTKIKGGAHRHETRVKKSDD